MTMSHPSTVARAPSPVAQNLSLDFEYDDEAGQKSSISRVPRKADLASLISTSHAAPLLHSSSDAIWGAGDRHSKLRSCSGRGGLGGRVGVGAVASMSDGYRAARAKGEGRPHGSRHRRTPQSRAASLHSFGFPTTSVGKERTLDSRHQILLSATFGAVRPSHRLHPPPLLASKSNSSASRTSAMGNSAATMNIESEARRGDTMVRHTARQEDRMSLMPTLLHVLYLTGQTSSIDASNSTSVRRCCSPARLHGRNSRDRMCFQRRFSVASS
jgi:hypothetical protein